MRSELDAVRRLPRFVNSDETKSRADTRREDELHFTCGCDHSGFFTCLVAQGSNSIASLVDRTLHLSLQPVTAVLFSRTDGGVNRYFGGSRSLCLGVGTCGSMIPARSKIAMDDPPLSEFQSLASRRCSLHDNRHLRRARSSPVGSRPLHCEAHG